MLHTKYLRHNSSRKVPQYTKDVAGLLLRVTEVGVVRKR
ncbi:hypothetical protein CCACVL1_27114 [Corchorus capsularis]|uniref:Uncharacterized protein n=1 Tax=Corchorus capsularis TaxID=210143 RepID=A0A1R3GC66_COCAP|nr:hypothetical protein CCACVL1_27114 [Corchorus capsularis]